VVKYVNSFKILLFVIIAVQITLYFFGYLRPSIIYDYWEEKAGSDQRLDIPDDEYQSGRVAFYGLTLGYKKRLKKDFALEFFVGAGLTQSWYKGYKGLRRVDLDDPVETVYRPFNGSGEVVAYRGGLMLTYKIPNFNNQTTIDE